MGDLPKLYKDNSIIFSTAKVFRKISLFKEQRFCQVLIDNLRFYRKKYKIKLYAFVIMPNHLHLLFHFPLRDGDDGRAVINPRRRAVIDRGRAVINPWDSTTPTRIPIDLIQDLIDPTLVSAGPSWVSAGPASSRAVYYTDFLRDFKSHSARQIIDILKKESSTLLQRFRFQGPKNYQYKIWRKSSYDFNIYTDKKFDEKLHYIHNNPIRAGLVKDLKNYPWSSYHNYYLNNHRLIKIDY